MSNLNSSVAPLKKATFFGLIWTFTDTFLLRGISFFASIVFARLLGPTEFGIIGMTTLFISVGTSLIDSGLTASLIRTLHVDEADYNTVFYMSLITSVLVYAVLFFTAPLIAVFYHQPILVDIIRIYCITFIVSALSSVQVTILNREMRFRKIVFLNFPGVIAGAGVGIFMAYNGYGVWSIVIMYLTTQTVQSLLLWIFSSWKPKLLFSKSKMKFHYGFGYKLMLSGLLDTTFKNIYSIVIGKFFPVRTLGYYDRASTLNEYPVTILTGVISKVSYPLLSKLQADKVRIAASYKQLLQATFFVIAPLMLIMASVASPLISIVLGNQWLPAVPFFQIICFASLLYPIHAFNINVLKVFGRSDLFLKLEIIKKVIVVISLVVTFRFGLTGILWSSVFSSFAALFVNTYYSKEMINYNSKQQFADMIPTLIISAIAYAASTFLASFITQLSVILQIILPFLGGIIVYLIISYFANKKPFLLLTSFIK